MKKPDINVEYTGVGLYKEPTNGYPLPGQEEWENYWWDVEGDTTKLDEQIKEGFYSIGAIIRLYCRYDRDDKEWKVSSHHPLLELSPEEEDVSRL